MNWEVQKGEASHWAGVWLLIFVLTLFVKAEAKSDRFTSRRFTCLKHSHPRVSGMTKKLEEALQEEKFVISLKHLEPRKRSSAQRSSMEPLFAAVFTGTDQKMTIFLDRHAKRGEFCPIKLRPFKEPLRRDWKSLAAFMSRQEKSLSDFLSKHSEIHGEFYQPNALMSKGKIFIYKSSLTDIFNQLTS